MADNKAKTKVFLNNSIWVDQNGVAVKKPKGHVAYLTKDEIKHFGKAVTKDIPEEFEQ
jgi:hypothetical protein